MGLEELRGEDGVFRVLAVDHRDSLRVFLEPTAPESVPDELLTEIKCDLVRAVSPEATGVMLEPEYSIPQVIDAGALAPGVGFLAALESQGYLGDPAAAPTSILAGWSVAQAAACGASAAKLLLPYHPDRPLAAAQRAVADRVLGECREVGLPLALEPLFYGVSTAAERERVVLTTVDHFASTGADLLKLPFPVEPDVVLDRDDRVAACRRVTDRCLQPWALLSGGGDFDSFATQVEAALAGGASGFMVGRALWGDAARASSADRAHVIANTVLPRWRRLIDITDRAVARRDQEVTS